METCRRTVEATLHTTPAAATHWTVRTMAKAQGVSHAIVHRIWRAHGLQPHHVEPFKLSRDPEFVKKLSDVVGVYLHPPERAPWCSVWMKKPQVQALDRTEPILPLRPGIPARQTHHYIRHGTTNLFAALKILDGTVLARPSSFAICDWPAAKRVKCRPTSKPGDGDGTSPQNSPRAPPQSRIARWRPSPIS